MQTNRWKFYADETPKLNDAIHRQKQKLVENEN